MKTRFKDSGKTIKVITQQYEVGLYVAVYENDVFVDQFCLEDSEEEYHKKLREEYKDFLIID